MKETKEWRPLLIKLQLKKVKLRVGYFCNRGFAPNTDLVYPMSMTKISR